MKIRLLPAIVTAVLSAGLLIGGWYIYRNVATVQPLERIVSNMPGVKAAKPFIGSDAVTVDLTLAPDANLRDVYEAIVEDGASVIGNREVKLNISEEKSGGRLDEAWSSMLFSIAEAMDHRNYSKIPAVMKEAEQKYKGLQATSEIDDTNVYITLKDSDTAKHIVLPRKPETFGVWPSA